MGALLLVILLVALVGSMPTWSHSRSWGYGPVGVSGFLVLVLVVLLLTGWL
ncbi:DUF3309 domain-containing protein [Massilia sp. KIM]|uniref:DUF3309 family protein n=1 Tax=Massilia sp. KIM TaxID=1955422 RepID=UPI00098EA3E1|nr:DUF3309 family protein [Massilia sp. KIM]OON63622.1 DUF3309 domain-containing protein [Massilia sp. KIM]